MKQTREQFIANGHFAHLRELNEQFLAAMREREAKNILVTRRYAHAESMRTCLSSGCIALLLGDSDEHVHKSFRWQSSMR
jgi:hypothetical protein